MIDFSTPLNALAAAMLLALIVKSLLDFLAKPIRMKFPALDLWWFDYVALVIGFAVCWFANIDLLQPLIPTAAPLLTKIVTGLLVGGGTNLLNQIFSTAPAVPVRTERGLEAPDWAERPYGW